MSEPPVLAVQLDALHRRFGDFVAVQQLDLEIGDGEFFSLIGPSGCGKTTTLRMIAGLEHPTSGRIRVRDRDVTDDPAYRRPVNTVFQNYALFPHLDIFENVAFGLRERRIDRTEVRRRVSAMLELVQLEGRERQKPRQLSGGQQQRVALARALVLRPEVLLLDEPLGALDLKLRKQMQLLIKSVQQEVGITFVYVTHDQEEAFSMSTRVGVMNNGALEQVAVPREVYRHPATVFVADFVGASNHVAARIVEAVARDQYRITVPGLTAPVVCPGPEGLTSGAAATLVLRPDALGFSSRRQGDDSVEGVVTDVSYSGPATTYGVDTQRFGALRVAQGGDAPDVTVGERVTLVWTPATLGYWPKVD